MDYLSLFFGAYIEALFFGGFLSEIPQTLLHDLDDWWFLAANSISEI